MFALPVPDYRSLPKFREEADRADPAAEAEAIALLEPHVFIRHLRITERPARMFEPVASAGPLLGRLQRDGYVLTTAHAEGKARLAQATEALFAELQRTLDANPRPYIKAQQTHLNRADHAEVYEAAEAAIADTGVIQACEAYQGLRLQLGNMALQINEDRITALHQGSVDERGVPAHRTSYFHIDSASWPHVRVILYMRPVGLDHGPFRYVPGTHRLADPVELAVRKANHKVNLPPRLFMALPDNLRAKSDFGNDLDDRSPLAEDLLRREVACCDGRSDLVLFDYNGVHRGGFVRKGRRRVVTFGFIAA